MLLESTHLFAAFGLGFTLGMGLITAIVIWFTCKHEYEVIDSYKKHIHYNDIAEHVIKHIYVSRCKHCGKIKKMVI